MHMKLKLTFIMAILVMPFLAHAGNNSWQWILVHPNDSGWVVRKGTIEIHINDEQIFGFIIENNKKVGVLGGQHKDKKAELTVTWYQNNEKERYVGTIHRELIDPFDMPPNQSHINRKILYRLFSGENFLYLKQNTTEPID